jgi:uncharacterized protein (DUF1810 family)
MNSSDELQRFVDAQDPVYAQVCDELRAGHKSSHWMWFVFPQFRGLGESAMAKRYAIASSDEALAYLAHPILGARLLYCTELMLRIEGKSALQILGSPDDMKFRSCMTLFSLVQPGQALFKAALNKYFAGRADQKTVEMLEG